MKMLMVLTFFCICEASLLAAVVPQPTAGQVAVQSRNADTSVPLKGKMQAVVSVADFGAKGDGVTDDTRALQAALNYCFVHKVHILEFDKGHTYLMSSNASQNSLVIYGSDLIVDGAGSSIVSRSATAGDWGAVIDIGGLIHGRTYPVIGKYSGQTEVAKNVTVKNLIIRHESQPKYMNSIGIHNASGVLVSNVRVINSPQTGIAVVAVSSKWPVSGVVLDHCEVDSSGNESYRVSLQETANTLVVLMDHCISKNVRYAELDREVRGQRVQLWYRAGGHGGNVGLKVLDSSFDASGVILANMSSRNLVLEGNDLGGGLVLKNGLKDDPGFKMQGNRFGGVGLKDLRARSQVH